MPEVKTRSSFGIVKAACLVAAIVAGAAWATSGPSSPAPEPVRPKLTAPADRAPAPHKLPTSPLPELSVPNIDGPPNSRRYRLYGSWELADENGRDYPSQNDPTTSGVRIIIRVIGGNTGAVTDNLPAHEFNQTVTSAGHGIEFQIKPRVPTPDDPDILCLILPESPPDAVAIASNTTTSPTEGAVCRAP